MRIQDHADPVANGVFILIPAHDGRADDKGMINPADHPSFDDFVDPSLEGGNIVDFGFQLMRVVNDFHPVAHLQDKRYGQQRQAMDGDEPDLFLSDEPEQEHHKFQIFENLEDIHLRQIAAGQSLADNLDAAADRLVLFSGAVVQSHDVNTPDAIAAVGKQRLFHYPCLVFEGRQGNMEDIHHGPP